MTPRGDDAAAKALHSLFESLSDATGVLLHLRAYLEALEARYVSLGKFVIRLIVVVGVGMVVALAVTSYQVRAVEGAQDRALNAAERAEAATKELQRLAAKNTIAIRVSCTLLSNTILEAQAPRPEGSNDTLGQLIGVLVSDLPPAKRREALRLAMLLGGGSSRLTVPNCDRVAAHPEDVIAIQRKP